MSLEGFLMKRKQANTTLSSPFSSSEENPALLQYNSKKLGVAQKELEKYARKGMKEAKRYAKKGVKDIKGMMK